jgi:pro-sigmaK processing inhibitor BofA
MIFPQYNQALAYGFLVILLFIGVRLFHRPLKRLARFALKGVIYTGALFLINLIGGAFGFAIGINYITVATCAALGVPGVVALSLIQIMGL